MVLQVFVRHPSGVVRAAQAEPDDSVASLSGMCFPDATSGAGVAALRVVHGGHTLDPQRSLAAAGVAAGATLDLLPRLRGGGGDGGSTGAESRSCYLEMYAGKKKDKVNPEEERLARWTTCQLSGMPLQPPCVADELGSLFNKDAVLQALLSKSMPKSLAHISSLKHLTELKLEEGAAGAGGDSAGAAVHYACPITGQAFNGKYKFVVFRKSGHVLSERSLKEVPTVVQELVGGKWDPQDLLTVNPTGEELQQLREQLLVKRAAERLAKKEKKKDKVSAAAASNGDAGEPAAASSKRAAEAGAGAASSAAAANGGEQNNGAAAAAAAKRFKAAELKPKHADDQVWNSLFTSSRQDEPGKRNDYMVRAATRYVS